MQIETETLDKLYLEIAQFTKAKSCKELALEQRIDQIATIAQKLAEQLDYIVISYSGTIDNLTSAKEALTLAKNAGVVK